MELLHLPRTILQTQQVQKLVTQLRGQQAWFNKVGAIHGQMVIK